MFITGPAPLTASRDVVEGGQTRPEAAALIKDLLHSLIDVTDSSDSSSFYTICKSLMYKYIQFTDGGGAVCGCAVG